MWLFNIYKSENNFLYHLCMKFSKKIAVLMFIISALVLAQVAFSEAASKDYVDRFISMLSDEDKGVRESAVRELGNLEDPAALDALNDLWNEEMDDEVVFAIEIAVSKLQLLDIDRKVRINGAEGLGEKASTRTSADATADDIEGLWGQMARRLWG